MIVIIVIQYLIFGIISALNHNWMSLGANTASSLILIAAYIKLEKTKKNIGLFTAGNIIYVLICIFTILAIKGEQLRNIPSYSLKYEGRCNANMGSLSRSVEMFNYEDRPSMSILNLKKLDDEGYLDEFVTCPFDNTPYRGSMLESGGCIYCVNHGPITWDLENKSEKIQKYNYKMAKEIIEHQKAVGIPKEQMNKTALEILDDNVLNKICRSIKISEQNIAIIELVFVIIFTMAILIQM